MSFKQAIFFMKKLIVIVFLAVFQIFRLFAVEAVAENTGEQKAFIFEDAGGTVVTVKLPVKRLVVLTSDALEIIRSLEASDLVIGVYSGILKNVSFWPELKNRSRVGTWKEINYERVVDLDPDAVLCYGMRPGKDMEKKLAPFGIQVIRLDFFKPATLVKEVEILGRILGKEKQAGRLAAWYEDHLNHVKGFLENQQSPPKVYIEGNSHYHTAGPGSGGHDMCVSAGGRNIAAGLSIPYPEVTSEWIVTADPDVIVKTTSKSTGASCYSMANARTFELIQSDIMTRPAWNHIHGVAKNRVYVIANEIWTGPRAVVGMYYLVKWFYPDMASAFEPEILHKQYIENFQGIPYQGAYVYPDDGMVLF